MASTRRSRSSNWHLARLPMKYAVITTGLVTTGWFLGGWFGLLLVIACIGIWEGLQRAGVTITLHLPPKRPGRGHSKGHRRRQG